MKPDRNTVIHHTATPRGRDVSAAEIREWHKQRGFRDIGYHMVIRLDGSIEHGRAWHDDGAHARGHNDDLGVALVGTGPDFTPEQLQTLEAVCIFLVRYYPDGEIRGHKDLAATECPGFDVRHWLRERGLLNGSMD